ncbi:MAG: phosphoribosylformylglycinamidine synthase [Treponema sp.]|jgi:phosphoribosylformylglycinamidine synthase|nr:phosphoribosylformylglycinamidine synthase [Treponema sp.]
MTAIQEIIRRVYVEKREGFTREAEGLQQELSRFLGSRYPELAALQGIRILHRYDVARLTEAQFNQAVALVLSEPQCDRVFYGASIPVPEEDRYFGIEYLPGQYDQRADSAEQCIELVTGVKPEVRTARFYILQSSAPLSDAALTGVKRYLINPVDSREASPHALLREAEPEVRDIPVLTGFSHTPALAELRRRYGLAMSEEDLRFCQSYFVSVSRDPSLAELRLLDTYWSDHCRHTTFTTELHILTEDDHTPELQETIPDPALKQALALYEATRKYVYGDMEELPKKTLMDLATLGAKALKKQGLLEDLDESREINACTIKVFAEFRDGGTTVLEPWFLLFKNETHNHPTEIEPFGGAATCLGGAIRDPLSGRAYVHQAMRITGGGDLRAKLSETLPGKLPQLQIARESAEGFASYGNQIGLATGQVAEWYHPGFLAKRLELGAVIGAVPAAWVRREEPKQGDLVILLGGKTGRDGIGGATGSSKAHTAESVAGSGAEVQKGNALEERKLQRLFRNPEVSRLIKRCNDCGAGGISVAVGELAPGLTIDLDEIPKKYTGLDGIELALSESQERMAVVLAPEDAAPFIRYAHAENLEASVIAEVLAGDAPSLPEGVAAPRLCMRWRGKTIVDLARPFLDSGGAPRVASVLLPGLSPEDPAPAGPEDKGPPPSAAGVLARLKQELGSLRSCSRRGLQERFDGSIGAASVLFPWGGKDQGTPECGMASLLPALDKQSCTASLMSFGYNPDVSSRNPYAGAKGAVREALAKIACLGGKPWASRLSLQEYFERPETAVSWGKPAAALLGALEAQLVLKVPAIGGKDSMAGTFTDNARGIHLRVPPTLVAFAAGIAPAASVCSGALSGEPGNPVLLLYQDPGKDEWDTFKANMETLMGLHRAGLVRAAYPVGPGGLAATLAVMAFGNTRGLEVEAETCSLVDHPNYQGSVVVELDRTACSPDRLAKALAGAGAGVIGAKLIPEPAFRIRLNHGSAELPLRILREAYEDPLNEVYPQTAQGRTVAGQEHTLEEPFAFEPEELRKTGAAPRAWGIPRGVLPKPRGPLVVLPVFPGTNGEWDMERAFRRAGGYTQLVIFRNRNPPCIQASIRELAQAIAQAQILALSGGFSAGDEPEGSGKFIANVFRAPLIMEAVTRFLEVRDGLILGICNGFQALIKLGLVPYGTYRAADAAMPALTFNRIGRHVSRMVRTRVMANGSPWLSQEAAGSIHVIPVSHGEGRLVIRKDQGTALFKAGQVPFCYVNAAGMPTGAEPDNPNGSDFGIEGLTSPDGRILGKMGHSERSGAYIHSNIPGNKCQRIFEAGVGYFT